MSAEDVLRFYCNATTADEQCACLARTALLEALSRNLPNNELSMPFVPSFSPVGGVQSIEAMADGVYAVTLASGDVYYPQMALEDGAWRIMSFFNTGY